MLDGGDAEGTKSFWMVAVCVVEGGEHRRAWRGKVIKEVLGWEFHLREGASGKGITMRRGSRLVTFVG